MFVCTTDYGRLQKAGLLLFWQKVRASGSHAGLGQCSAMLHFVLVELLSAPVL